MDRKYNSTRPEKSVYPESNSNPPTKVEMTTPQFGLSLHETDDDMYTFASADLTTFERLMFRLTILIIAFLSVVFSFFLIIMKPILIVPCALVAVAIISYRKMVKDVQKK